MPKYAIAKYGVDKYGDKAGSKVYYASDIIAVAKDYGQITVTWTPITPDPADTAPTYWKVVKSYLGEVDNPDDGIQVDGDAYPTFRLTATDIAAEDEPGREVNYSIWVYNPTDGWIFCGSDNEVLVKDDGTLSKITKWIPRVWLNESNGVGDALGEADSSNRLTQLLSAYAFQYDSLRSQINVLSNTSNPEYVHTSLLPHLVEDAGFSYEPSLGDPYHATLYALGDAVMRNKGTNVGVASYINALTHLDSEVNTGHNLLLDYNDASFEESLGRWSASSGTFVQKLYTTSSYPVPYSYDNQFPLRNKGYASLTTAATTAVTLTLPGNSYGVTSYGIPVEEGVRYLFSGWTKRIGTVSATLTAKIYWYNSIGGLISSTVAGPSLTIGTSWAEFVTASDSGRNGKTAPTNAAFAKVELTVTPSTSTSVEYTFDMLQFAEYSNSLVYEDARLVTAYLKGDRTNVLLNPSFEAGTSFWNAYNGELTHNSVGVSGLVKSGSYVSQLTVSDGTHLYLPGTTGNFASVPSNAAFNITGDIDLRALVAFADWTPATAQTIISKYDNNTLADRSYEFNVTAAGLLQLIWANSTTTSITANSTVAPTITDGSPLWVRAVLDVDNGAAGYSVFFYTSRNGTSWYQLGTTVTAAGVTTINAAATEQLGIGRRSTGNINFFSGKIYRAQILNSTATPVLDADFRRLTSTTTTTFTEYSATAATVTINKSGSPSAAVVLNTTAALVSDWVAPEPGKAITFSGYVSGDSGRTVKARLEYSHRPTSATTISATITGVTGDGTTVTVTANNTFTAGETVTISGVTPTNYNISGTIATATDSSFTITSSQTGTYVSGGTATMNLQPSNTIYASGSNEYYSNVVYYVESDPITMDGTMKLIQVTATTPLYEKDSGAPLVKASIIPTSSRIGDVYSFDGLSIQYSDTAKEYFSGSGGILPSNPLTTKFFASSDCIWEKGERRNYVSNPSFETTTGWTGTGITLTSEVPPSYAALFGTNSGKCVYSSTGYIQTTVYLDEAAIGGEDVTVSAYVRGAVTDYTIATNPGGTLPTSSTVKSTIATYDQWIRIHTTRKLAAGETSFTLRITATNPMGSSSTTFFIDGAQAEDGLIATKFINPVDAPTVTTIANPSNTSVNMYTTQEPSVGGGESTYIDNYATKFSRLYNTLSLVMPVGSTWRIVPGYLRNEYPDLNETLIPSGSFEKNFGAWQLSNATITRVISRGKIFGDYVTHGKAYARVATTRVSGSPSFFYGIYSSNIYIEPGAGYYIAAAIRPDNGSNALHPYRLTATFYDANGTVHNYDNAGVSTQAIFNMASTLVAGDESKWAYLSLVVPSYVTSANQFDLESAAYAVVKIDAEPATFNAAQAFHVDRVIFRQ